MPTRVNSLNSAGWVSFEQRNLHVARSSISSNVSVWVLATIPFLLLVSLVVFIIWYGPAEAVLGDDFPPVEQLNFQQVKLDTDGIVATVLNDGPDQVTIAQVQVDDAYWEFSATPSIVLNHLDRSVLTIPYPWVHGETHTLRLLTSNGVTFDYEITVAVQTPQPDTRYFMVFALIGLYVGVLPVTLGLLWFPVISKLGRKGLDFVIALTIGLLVFLMIETIQEGLETASIVPASLQGIALFSCVTITSFLSLETIGFFLSKKRQLVQEPHNEQGWVLAVLISIGIGLHNFGEGLAIGAAFALGEASLGTALIIGFTLHNTTEGIAIVSPLAKNSVRIRDLTQLGIIGGAPTIIGAWLGGLVYSPIWSVVFLAIGAGAIAQVIVQITRQIVRNKPVSQHLATAPVLSGLIAGFAVMYVTGMIVG